MTAATADACESGSDVDAVDDVDDDGEEKLGGSGETDSAVVAFLRDRVPRWELGATLIQLGMDPLDTVSMRNQFNKSFDPKPGPLPMDTFASPNRLLSELIATLEAAT